MRDCSFPGKGRLSVSNHLAGETNEPPPSLKVVLTLTTTAKRHLRKMCTQGQSSNDIPLRLGCGFAFMSFAVSGWAPHHYPGPWAPSSLAIASVRHLRVGHVDALSRRAIVGSQGQYKFCRFPMGFARARDDFSEGMPCRY